jgi:hypothetical protein
MMLRMRLVQTLGHTRDALRRCCCTRLLALSTLRRLGVRRTRGAAGRTGGAGRTQDSPRTRRRRRGIHEPAGSGTSRRPSRRGQAEDQAKVAWRRRAGAIGGGSTASFRWRRTVLITSPCVMAAMIRSDPR